MLPDRVKIYEGGWLKRNGGINRLIPEIYSKMGNHAAYYEVVCKIEERGEKINYGKAKRSITNT